MRPRLAVISTICRPKSHTEVIVTRWLAPRPSDSGFGWPAAGHEAPRTEIASFYIAQFHDEGREIDTGRALAAKYDVPIFDSVREALTLGTGDLAVDGVLLIGEHGQYPLNEWHQKMYPRRELFDQIVAVFREFGRSAPIFNDKHLSYDGDSARYMTQTAREMGFGLMAGSSVPVAGFLEPWTLPDGADLSQFLAIGFQGMDINGYHCLEWGQTLVARRNGGESGIQSVIAYVGQGLSRALNEGLLSPSLLEAAFGAVHQVPAAQFHQALANPEAEKSPYPLPAAAVFEHLDGLRSTYLLFPMQSANYTVAAQQKNGEIHAGCSALAGDTQGLFYPHFAVLCAHIEEFFLTGRVPFPIEHHLFCSLATEAACRALCEPDQTIQTPQLHLPY